MANKALSAACATVGAVSTLVLFVVYLVFTVHPLQFAIGLCTLWLWCWLCLLSNDAPATTVVGWWLVACSVGWTLLGVTAGAWLYDPSYADACDFIVGANQSHVRVAVRCPVERVRVHFDDAAPVDVALSADDDWTGVAVFSNGAPFDRQRRIAMTGGLVDRSATLTLRDPSHHYTLAFGSCLLPTLFSSLDSFAVALDALRPDALAIIGDAVYIDQPSDFDRTSVEAYWRRYRTLLASSPALADVRRRTPQLYMYDDHEIDNNWRAADTGRFATAIERAWRPYVGAVNPSGSYFNGSFGRVCYFMADTRRFRTATTFLGAEQTARLYAWLDWSAATCWRRILFSTVPLTLTTAYGDAWGAYSDERAALLAAIARRPSSPLVVASGDTHAAAVVHLTPTLVEVAASPLHAFTAGFPTYASTANETVLFTGHSSQYLGTFHWNRTHFRAAVVDQRSLTTLYTLYL